MAVWCPLSLGALSMCLVCLLVNPALLLDGAVKVTVVGNLGLIVLLKIL